MKTILRHLSIIFSCPIGYEDATGWHYGPEPLTATHHG